MIIFQKRLATDSVAIMGVTLEKNLCEYLCIIAALSDADQYHLGLEDKVKS